MKKKLQNFWYYYKVPVIIILAVLAVGVYLYSQRETVEADYRVAVVAARGCSDEQLARLKTVLTAAGQDLNGDGSVTVKIRVYRFAIGAEGQDMNEIGGLDADLVGKVSGLFFVEDPEGFEAATNGIGTVADAVPVRDIPLFSDCGIDELYLLIRSGADPAYEVLWTRLFE